MLKIIHILILGKKLNLSPINDDDDDDDEDNAINDLNGK